MTEPSGHKRKILVIDDDPVILKMLSERLKANGYDVHQASEAAVGLDMVFHADHDLIILDVMMPIINGYNFCRLVKTQEKLRSIPIIMVTGRSEETDKEIGEEVGADAYITKPFQMEDILTTIKNFLQKS